MLINKFFSKPLYAPDDATGTTAATESPWYTGADPVLVGHLQNRGWDKLDPKAAAIEAAKAHSEAERYVGVPAAQIARIPTDPKDAAGWAALRQKLGAPADATGYDFSTVKKADGTEIDAAFADNLRKTAFERGLSKDDAAVVADSLTKYLDQSASAREQERLAQVETERTELRKDWGPNYDALLFVAKNAAAKLGVSPEAVAALEGQVGYKAVMQLFQKVGTALGEDKFITSQAPGGNGVLTREQALAKVAELKADQGFVNRYLSGDVAAAREMSGLHVLIAGGDDTDASRFR